MLSVISCHIVDSCHACTKYIHFYNFCERLLKGVHDCSSYRLQSLSRNYVAIYWQFVLYGLLLYITI